MDGKITFKDILDELNSAKIYCDKEDEFRKKNPDNKYGHSEDYIKGYRAAAFQMYLRMKDSLPLEEVCPKIREITEDEKKEFTIKRKFIATAMDVSVNSLYGITLEEGKEYETEDVPYGIFEYRGEKVPVYVDDPGQQDYCVFNGKEISGGAYNMCPELEFAYAIDYMKFYDKEEEEAEHE